MGFFCRYYTPTGPAVPAQTLSIQPSPAREAPAAYVTRAASGRDAGLSQPVRSPQHARHPGGWGGFHAVVIAPTQQPVSLAVQRCRTRGMEFRMKVGWQFGDETLVENLGGPASPLVKDVGSVRTLPAS